jgi:hypothetical protein
MHGSDEGGVIHHHEVVISSSSILRLSIGEVGYGLGISLEDPGSG